MPSCTTTTMPPSTDFSSSEYWQARFTTQEPASGFDWLFPSASLRDLLVELLPPPSCSSSSYAALLPPTVLHIGSGSSSLSNDLRTWLPHARTTNVDFAPAAVEWGGAREQEAFPDNEEGKGGGVVGLPMGWAVVDLLDSKSVTDLLRPSSTSSLDQPTPTPTTYPSLFDLIVDKSSTDAVSCGPGNPVRTLARNLAHVVREGGRWVCMSYSSDRFHGGELLGGLWDIERVERRAVPEAEDGGAEQGGFVSRPKVEHGIWVLRRTGALPQDVEDQ